MMNRTSLPRNLFRVLLGNYNMMILITANYINISAANRSNDIGLWNLYTMLEHDL